MLADGIAHSTVKLANKGYRADRYADEALAVFAVLSPIVTGRDCILFTADEDVIEQTRTLCKMLFDDYGAFLVANDFRNNDFRRADKDNAVFQAMLPRLSDALRKQIETAAADAHEKRRSGG
jgi:hypothetical protein